MPSLKDLRTRINSVKSTKKITKAMALVSSSKLSKAKNYYETSSKYTAKVFNMFEIMKADSSQNQLPEFVIDTDKRDKFLIVVVTSDKGLCGAFNNSVIKKVKDCILELKNSGKDFEILCFGKKGYEILKWNYGAKTVEYPEGLLSREISFLKVEKHAKKILEMFNSKKFDVCKVFYNKFISSVLQEPKANYLIPFEKYSSEDENISKEKKSVEKLPIYDYEPEDKNELLHYLAERSFVTKLFSIFLQNSVGEYSARMIAMDNASNNAGKMIDKLTLVYNRKRQFSITEELIEIISGAEAL